MHGWSRVGIALALVGLLSADAASGSSHHRHARVPNLTGKWANKAAPTAAPPWKLKASNHRRTLDATWRGSKSNGHPALRGSFHTTLQSSHVYKGTYEVTENAPPAGGKITVTIDSPHQIEFDLRPSGGGSTKYVFIRVASARR